jgi:hypothetical protein
MVCIQFNQFLSYKYFLFVYIEKRLAMKLISRTMQDMQHHENEYISTRDQSNFNK